MTEALAIERPRRVNIELGPLHGSFEAAEVIVQDVGDIVGRTVVVIACHRVDHSDPEFFAGVVTRLLEEGVELIEFAGIHDKYWGWVSAAAAALRKSDRVMRGGLYRRSLRY